MTFVWVARDNIILLGKPFTISLSPCKNYTMIARLVPTLIKNITMNFNIRGIVPDWNQKSDYTPNILSFRFPFNKRIRTGSFVMLHKI